MKSGLETIHRNLPIIYLKRILFIVSILKPNKTYPRFALNNFHGRYIDLTETPSSFLIYFYPSGMEEVNGWKPETNTVLIDKEKTKSLFCGSSQ